MSPSLFDKAAIRKNRCRANHLPAGAGFLFDWTAAQIVDRLGDIKRTFPLALQIGTHVCAVTGIERTIGMDLAPNPVLFTHTLNGDAEWLPFADGSLDLIISFLTFHAANDLPGALIQIRRALKPDGLFLAALPGGETLRDLRTAMMEAETVLKGGASPRIYPFIDRLQMAGLMQRAGFALPVVDSETMRVTYRNPIRLLHDLRAMGEGNAMIERDKAYPGRMLFQKAAEIYQEQCGDEDGNVEAAFEIIFAIGWGPSDTQQKPLRRGSATHRLSDVL